MEQQPDKLFQEKLAGYSRPAPIMAWDKIEKKLDKKNNKVIWLRIAAAIVLLMVSIPVVYTLIEEPSTQLATDKTKPAIKSKDVAPSAPEAVDRAAVTTSDVKASDMQAQRSEKNDSANKNDVVADDHESIANIDTDTDGEIEDVTDAPSSVEEVDTVVMIAQVEQQTPPIAPKENSVVPNRGVTLVISAEETTSYLEKDENLSASEATTKGKKTSTLQKLLRKASDLKTNQDPFGELRQMKNEILAGNFKSDKKRSQKTN
jgi:hypothetical protein